MQYIATLSGLVTPDPAKQVTSRMLVIAGIALGLTYSVPVDATVFDVPDPIDDTAGELTFTVTDSNASGSTPNIVTATVPATPPPTLTPPDPFTFSVAFTPTS